MAPKIAPKRKVRGGQGSQVHDPKFVSGKAKGRFNDAQQKKLGWNKFTQTSPSTVAPIVKEFYANLPDSYNEKTRVRGKEVKFDVETINQYYELPQVKEGEYEYLKNVDYDKEKLTRSASASSSKAPQEDQDESLYDMVDTIGCDTSRYKLSEMIYRPSEADEEDDEEASDESMEE
ncbi:hypothetical protein Patl1_36747 [Pistacia atlantica]|nr:hypothetical protein Patl1_36747 [Pistacia atlantica]